MTDADLRERAKRVGEETSHEQWRHEEAILEGLGASFHILCPGCRATRAALDELRAAVAEERAAVLKAHNPIDSNPNFCHCTLCERARGER